MGEDERADLVAKVAGVRSAFEAPDAIDGVARGLGEIRHAIESFRAQIVADLRCRLEAVRDTCGEGERERIGQSIDDGYLRVAIELISRIEDGESIEWPADTQDDPFHDFMSVVGDIERAMDVADGPRPAEICRAAATSRRAAGVSFEGMPPREATQSERFLKAWYELSNTKRLAEKSEALDTFLLLLGWQVRTRETVEAGRGWADVTLRTEKLGDRSLCPVAEYGSQAEGQYRLLLNWSPSVSALVARVVGSAAGASTVILHFGRLGPEREKLRRSAIMKRRLFLVIDEALVLYLAARRTDRLFTMFCCALPFTSVEPHVTTSGLVPPELFYGRTDERKSIMEPLGTCFIYGGRQLGKTALLRSVERDSHRPDDGRLAKWIDLKVRGIGSLNPAGDIWPLIASELRDLPVVKGMKYTLSRQSPLYAERLIGVIEKWINAKHENRLLLLLDEADEFLAADAKSDFRESTRLKGLMDRTGRRFKVVLAGLHNVLRATERSNHPLAHFGQPIQVGPLLSNGEWHEAQSLVREPLRTVGCRFEKEELATRVLAQTNYYPSLIQLYGEKLVRHLRDSKKPFPYVVTSDDLTAVYRAAGLRDAMRLRFRWTLQLDQRYEVVAYAVAEMITAGTARIENGIRREDIARSARDWWKPGFGQTTDGEFNVLLDEMVGLGILRPVSGGGNDMRYTLRNPNILSLIGNTDEIEGELLKEREVQKRSDPSIVHPMYQPFKGAPLKHAPLTHEQVGRLVGQGGVAVVSGSDNGNVGYVPEYLEGREDELFTKFPHVADAVDFERRLREIKPPAADMVNVVLVSPETTWNFAWLMAAGRAIKRDVRLVFVAKPELLWSLVTEIEGSGFAGLDHIEWFAVRPWEEAFVRVWVDDNQFSLDREQRRELMHATGGWPVLLERFMKRRRANEWTERIQGMEKELEREKKTLLENFGMSSLEVKRELLELLKYEPFGEEMLEEIGIAMESSDVAVRQRMEWCERLGVVSLMDGEWTFNPLIARLLSEE